MGWKKFWKLHRKLIIGIIILIFLIYVLIPKQYDKNDTSLGFYEIGSCIGIVYPPFSENIIGSECLGIKQVRESKSYKIRETAVMETTTPEEAVEVAKSVDFDKDGFSNFDDNCPAVYNPDQKDSNNDGFGDACEE